jgi:predicted enzyme related to lactoylglutathione lyase
MLAKSQLATLLPIRDMNRAIRFYTKVLGGKVTFRAPGEMKDFFASLSLGSNEIWLITPEKREKRTLAYSTFIVKNIRTTVKGLQAKGVKFKRAEKMGPETKVEGPIAFESFGAAAFFNDTEGNVLMVWQASPRM